MHLQMSRILNIILVQAKNDEERSAIMAKGNMTIRMEPELKAQAGTGIQPIPDLPSFINLVLLAFLPTVVSNITLVQAVHHIGSTLTSVLGATEPVTAVCVGVLVFGEPFTPHLALGILLIIVAVTLIILSKYIQKNLHEAKRLFKARHILRTK